MVANIVVRIGWRTVLFMNPKVIAYLCLKYLALELAS